MTGAVLILFLAVVPCSEARAISKPCFGILIPTSMAQAAANTKINLARCQELNAHQAEVCRVELQAMRDRLTSCEDARGRASELARKAAEVEKPAPWYLRPSIVAPAAFIAGVVFGLTANK